MSRYDLSILILLYNKEIKSSSTILSLIKSKLYFENCSLIIWNNGPSLIKDRNVDDLVKLGFDVKIHETLNNESLSYIYNKHFDINISRKYAFLDDDSTLNDCYLENILISQGNKLYIPLVKSNGKVKSPKCNGDIITETECFVRNKQVVAIGSGLTVGVDIAESIKEVYGNVFDERFYFYGVDTTFCYRYFKVFKNANLVLIPGFEHSLSKELLESKSTKDFRKHERGFDTGLRLRYYESKSYTLFLKNLIKNSILSIFGNNDISCFSLCYGFIVGRHQRKSKNDKI